MSREADLCIGLNNLLPMFLKMACKLTNPRYDSRQADPNFKKLNLNHFIFVIYPIKKYFYVIFLVGSKRV